MFAVKLGGGCGPGNRTGVKSAGEAGGVLVAGQWAAGAVGWGVVSGRVVGGKLGLEGGGGWAMWPERGGMGILRAQACKGCTARIRRQISAGSVR